MSKTTERAKGRSPANGNGSGRNKSRAKKREWKAHCRTMRVSGYITDQNGTWFKPGDPLLGRGTTEK